MIFYWQTYSALKESKNLSINFNLNEIGNFSVAHAEAVVQRCSLEKVFPEIFKTHRKTPVPEFLF